MPGPLIAIVGDTNPQRTFDPVMKDPAKAKNAAVELRTELAKRGARLLVYGGPFLEADRRTRIRLRQTIPGPQHSDVVHK